MSINLNSLRKVISNLPRPKHVEERYRIAIPARVDELNLKYLGEGKDPPVEAQFVKEYMLVAKRYCKSPNNCWLEWELDL